MKAVVLTKTGGPENLEIQDIDTPEPGPGQVRVRIHAAALNRRDFWITKGLYPGLDLPAVLGSDGAGIIDKAGDGVDNSRTGEEVIIYPGYDWGDDPRVQSKNYRILGMPKQGTFAEYICVPLEYIHPKPGHLDWGETAAFSLAALTAWRAVVTKAGVIPGMKLLVTGIGGGVATTIMLFAAARGAEVYVTSGSDAKIARAQSLGARGGVNYHNDDWDAELKKMCGGVDVVIDGNAGSIFQSCFNVLNPAGSYIIYGGTRGNPPEGINIARLFFSQIRIEGTTMGTPDEFAAMLTFVNANKLRPIIDKTYALEDAAAAHEYIGAGSQMGKVVLKII